MQTFCDEQDAVQAKTRALKIRKRGAAFAWHRTHSPDLDTQLAPLRKELPSCSSAKTDVSCRDERILERTY